MACADLHSAILFITVFVPFILSVGPGQYCQTSGFQRQCSELATVSFAWLPIYQISEYQIQKLLKTIIPSFNLWLLREQKYKKYTTSNTVFSHYKADNPRALCPNLIKNCRSIFTLSNAKHGRKYWNRSRGKLAFKGLSGKDYGTHGLN